MTGPDSPSREQPTADRDAQPQPEAQTPAPPVLLPFSYTDALYSGAVV